jgi:aspartate/methionine/tyrosine aminotransferase
LTSAETAVYAFFVQNPVMELDKKIENTPLRGMFSELGRGLYFPRGIVAQSAEAERRARHYNATVGMATLKGDPLCLPSIKKLLPGLSSREICAYAPTSGVAELRKAWQDLQLRKNPLLKGVQTSVPLVTAGITHGVSLAADLFADEGDPVLLPDMFWGNYRLIFETRRKARIITYPMFKGPGLDLEAFARALEGEKAAKLLLVFNFPHNPTGYSPSEIEAHALSALVSGAARKGRRVVVIIDDAYFGLYYEKKTFAQSLFGLFADLDKNILAVKLDGATKEDLGWGLRLGFITYAAASLSTEHYGVLENKTMGAVRSSVSSCSRLSQTLLLKSLKKRDYAGEKKRLFSLLKERYAAVKRIVGGRSTERLAPLPFNSGYFLTFVCRGFEAERLRGYLLHKRGIGTAAVSPHLLRVAFSGVDTSGLEEFFTELYQAADTVAGEGEP